MKRHLRFAAKILAPEQALSYVAAVTVKRIDSDGNNQYVRIHTHPVVDPYNWFMVDFVYNAMVTDADVYISFDNDYTGNNSLSLKHLFLVGGFAESPILQESIRKEFGRMMHVVIPQVIYRNLNVTQNNLLN